MQESKFLIQKEIGKDKILGNWIIDILLTIKSGIQPKFDLTMKVIGSTIE